MRLQLFNFSIIFTLANASAAESTNEKPRNSGQCNAQPECLVQGSRPHCYISRVLIHGLRFKALV